jgi:DnaK suppressor protein
VKPAKLASLKKTLLAKRAEALTEGPAKIEPNRRDAVSVGVADEDEQALSEMMQTLASQRNRKQSQRIAEIDKALRKIANVPDEFGLCEECEEEIAEKRLAIMPWATLCAECQEKRDPRRGGSRKNLTDFD